MKTGTCEKKVQDTPPLREVVRSEDAAVVPCDDSGLFRCSVRETCCRTSDTEWSCCPAQKVRSARLDPGSGPEPERFGAPRLVTEPAA